MNVEKTIGFIGGGRVTRILLKGFENRNIVFSEITVSDVNAEALNSLQKTFLGIRLAPNDNRAPAGSEIVFLALHPPAIPAVLEDIGSSLKAETVLVSLAPKITIARLAAALKGFPRVARMIPNACSIVNAGYNPLVFGGGIGAAEQERLRELFGAFGECPEVKEETLEAYAILTAMGPTYFWPQWIELENLAGSFGLGPEDARPALARMLEGSVRTLFSSGLSAEEVLDLIPVKPLDEHQTAIKEMYRTNLTALFNKLKS
jgi:pyrroline-5-carboxylate reductase